MFYHVFIIYVFSLWVISTHANRITHALADWPGSCHDGWVLRHSQVMNHFNDGEKMLIKYLKNECIICLARSMANYLRTANHVYKCYAGNLVANIAFRYC